MVPDRVTEAVRRAPRPVCAYVYDLGSLTETARTVAAALPAGVELYYAMKANAHPAVLAGLAPVVDGLEIASEGELAKAPAGSRVIFNGPAKTDDAIERALSAGASYVNAESRHDLERLAHVGARLGVRVPVLLRVNPRASAPPGSHRMAGAPTQFGIDSAGLDDAVRLARGLTALSPRGIHVHAVSNNLSAADHLAFVESSVALARLYGLDVVNAGGGFGIDYSGGGGHFDWEAFAAGLAEPALSGMTLILEPGRFLVARAGYYAASVLDVKENHGKAFAVLRGGSHHFRLPAAMRWNHPFTVVPVDEWPYPFARPSITGRQVTIAGELCTPSDVLARDVPVVRLRAGDVVVFSLAGAYSWEISHDRFLSHPWPEVILLGDRRPGTRSRTGRDPGA